MYDPMDGVLTPLEHCLCHDAPLRLSFSAVNVLIFNNFRSILNERKTAILICTSILCHEKTVSLQVVQWLNVGPRKYTNLN